MHRAGSRGSLVVIRVFTYLQGMETPLTVVTEAFKELACGMDADGGELRLAPFDDTCALVSVLFRSLGMAFRFAKIEYATKVSAR